MTRAPLTLLTLAPTLVSVAVAAPRLGRVTGTAERAIHARGPCGGGARVTDEQMQEWAAKTQRFPLAKTAFTVFAGYQRAGRPVTRFKTDRAGRFEVRLPEGVFCVMAGEQAEVAPEVSNGASEASRDDDAPAWTSSACATAPSLVTPSCTFAATTRAT